MVTKFGQFQKLKWPFSFLQFCIFFVVENIQICQFFWKNWFVNEFRTTTGGELLGISKKIISLFKIWQKMVTKFWQFKKLKCPNFVNCPNFVTIFCRVLKMKIFLPSWWFLTICLLPCVLQGGRHHHIKGRRNFWSNNLDDGNKNIFFCLKVWLIGRLAETSFNQFEQKLSKSILYGN